MNPKFVICGVEHSGTTLVSDVFRQVDGIDAGFEVGVLLSKSPKHFRSLEPFISNMKAGWELSDEQLDKICNCDTFNEFYTRLEAESLLIDKKDKIFDKTPRYFSELESCLTKIQCNFIVTYKDPRSLVYSDFKRTESKSFHEWFEGYAPKKLNYLKTIYSQYKACKRMKNKRVMMVSLEDIALDTRRTFEKIFASVGIEFKIKYLMLRKMRYKNTRMAYVSSKIPFEYMDVFSQRENKIITDTFSELDEWFYF